MQNNLLFPTPGEVREQMWIKLTKERALAYPYPPFGHHPNFKGATKAATLLLADLLKQGDLKPGDTVLSYPDYVLKGFRKGCLEAGINVVVPAKYGKVYRFLKTGVVKASKASTIAGAEKEGEMIKELPSIKLCAVACVAATYEGDVLTKGFGFSLPDEVLTKPIVGLLHPLQILASLPEPEYELSVWATPKIVSRLR